MKKGLLVGTKIELSPNQAKNQKMQSNDGKIFQSGGNSAQATFDALKTKEYQF